MKNNQRVPTKIGKLKVPLLKSPTHFGHYSSRVNRAYNEDKYSANVLTIRDEKVFNFNVFDGHGGDECSLYLQDRLSQEIEQADELLNEELKRDDLIKQYGKNIGGYWRRWYRHRKDNFVKMVNSNHEVKLQNIEFDDDLHIRLPWSF